MDQVDMAMMNQRVMVREDMVMKIHPKKPSELFWKAPKRNQEVMDQEVMDMEVHRNQNQVLVTAMGMDMVMERSRKWIYLS